MHGIRTATDTLALERQSGLPIVADFGLKIGLAGGATLLAVLFLELLVRTFAPQLLYRYPTGLFVNDPATDYRLAAGFSGRFSTVEYSTTVTVNSAGLRDSREFGAKLPGMRRILVLGDSFAMGHSVEERETFVRLVEDGLDATVGRPEFTLLNSGVPGFSTRQELAYLRSRGFALDPDAVVLAMFVGNDIADNANLDRHMTVIDGYLTNGPPPAGILPVSVRSFLARNSHLYQLVWPIQRRLRGQPLPKTEDPLAPCVISDEQLWKPTERVLAELAETVTARHLPLFIVLIPDMVQVQPELWRRVAGSRDGLDPFNPSRRMEAVADALHVPLIDLLPGLTEAARRERLYFPIDHHWTRAGNRIAAEAVVSFLMTQHPIEGARQTEDVQ